MIQRSIGSRFGHILMMFNSSSDGGEILLCIVCYRFYNRVGKFLRWCHNRLDQLENIV